MPEEKDDVKPSSSGAVSSEGKVKVLFGKTEAEHKPKVLSFADVSDVENETRAEVKSKVMVIGEVMPRAVQPTTAKVSVVLGDAIIRARIEVEISELRQIDASIRGEETLMAAMELIGSFNLDDNRDEKFTEFGSVVQGEYADKVQELFSLVNDKTVEEVKALIDRIVNRLNEFDPAKLLGESKSFLSLFFEKKDRDFKAEIQTAYNEIQTLIAKAKLDLPDLQKAKVAIDEFELILPRCLSKIESQILAGKYLYQYGQKKTDEQPKLVAGLNILERRVESLTISRITILQAFEQAKLFRVTILNLITNIDNALLTLVPLWYSGYLNALAMMDSKKFSKGNNTTAELLKLQTTIINSLRR